MGGFAGGHAAFCLAAVALAGSSCTTIDRPTAPVDPGPSRPHAVILQPAHDTTIDRGHNLSFLVTITSTTGLDTIYTDLLGTSASYPPQVDPGSPTVFGVSVRSDQMIGTAITLRVTTVDSLGQPGDTAVRVVQLQ